MHWNDVTNDIDPVILDRGRAYLLNGCVRSLEKIGDQHFRAQVQGSELYEIVVELDGSGAVLSLECDCPYDFGPVCKHQVAVLLMIRNDAQFKPIGKSGIMPSHADKRLKDLLEGQPKEHLIDLLLYHGRRFVRGGAADPTVRFRGRWR